MSGGHDSGARRPNIVVLLVDDLGRQDLGCYGSTFYQTPHIDALARRGMSFSDAYAACPVCSPTRASLLTGKYPARVGITDWIDWQGRIHPARGRLIDVPYARDLPRGERTLAAALADGGYATWHVGKWHLGGPGRYPEDCGFQVNIGGCEHGSPAPGGYFSPWSLPVLQDAQVPEGTYLTDYLGDRAAGLIRSSVASDPERPFFLNMCFYTVHTPIQGKPELVQRYRRRRTEMGLDGVRELEEGPAFPCEHKKDRRIVRRLVQSDPVYAAMVHSLDENVGKIVAALESAGVLENTIVVFTSDNGGLSTAEGSPTCNAPFSEGKGWMYEGGTREPLIVCGPAVARPGTQCEEPVTSPDFYPTLLELAGLPPDRSQHVDGVSFAAALRGETFSRGPIFWHYPHYGNQGGTPAAAVREGDWKLIRFFEDGHQELYNVREDVGEQSDRAAVEPQITVRLAAELSSWQQEIEALIPELNPEYRPWTGRAPCGHYPAGTGPEV